VAAADSLSGHALTYAWTAVCPTLGSGGSFSDAAVENPTWTAPSNTTGAAQSCTLRVTVTDGAGGLTQSGEYRQTVNSVAHTLTLTSGPSGLPNPVGAGGGVAASVVATDSLSGHPLTYAWTAVCPTLGSAGTFSDASAATPTWTAPTNASGLAQTCTLSVTVTDGAGGLSQSASYQQTVDSVAHTLTITSGPNGTPNPVASGGSVAATVTAADSLSGHTVTYAWTSACPTLGSGGSFSSPSVANPTWTAPPNTSGAPQACTLTVTLSDGQGLIQNAQHSQSIAPVLPAPTAFAKVAPGPGAAGQLTGLALRWTSRLESTSYEYCIDTIANAACDTAWVPAASTSIVLNTLSAGTTYSWQVRARNASGDTLADGGSWWTFATQAASPTDSNANGLPDSWESQFGLTADDGPLDDPDGDGIPTIDELRAGTHPRGLRTVYLAEGATNAFFKTRLALLNAAEHSAHVLLQFQNAAGVAVPHALLLAPWQRTTVDVQSVAGMAAAEFSTVLEADTTVVLDRTMTWGDGYGSHAETGIPAPATTWYLAEGATHSGFNLFYLLQNPNATAVDVTVKYLRPAPLPPLTRTYRVEPTSRFNIWVDAEGPELSTTDLSAVITAQQPIIVERAMYLDVPGQVRSSTSLCWWQTRRTPMPR
jgi:phage-related protein